MVHFSNSVCIFFRKVLPSPSFPHSAERPIAVARHRLDRGQGMRITFANTSTELPVSSTHH